MKQFLAYYRSIASVSVGLAILAGIALHVFTRSGIYPAGLAIGTVAGLIKLRMDVVTILHWHARTQAGSAGPSPQLRAYFSALLLLGLALAPGLLLPGIFNVWAGLGGYLLPRGVLVADGLLRPGALQPEESGPGAAASEAEGRTAHGA